MLRACSACTQVVGGRSLCCLLATGALPGIARRLTICSPMLLGAHLHKLKLSDGSVEGGW
jgi:hypothetical protein